jgi:hypothetical protein
MDKLTPAQPESPPSAAHSRLPESIPLDWGPIIAGASIAAGTSFVLFSFGTAIGLMVGSASATWRDTSNALALLSGLWLLLTALVSFALGGYLAGRLRVPWSGTDQHEVQLRDGTHGLVVWGVAVIAGGLLALSTARMLATETSVASGGSATVRQESLMAFELDRMFRADRNAGGDNREIREQATRIISASLGHRDIAADDRAYLVRMVQARTGISPADAEQRVTQGIAQAREAVGKARRAGVILAFMTAASLLVGAAVAWLAAMMGGKHRDQSVTPEFWRHWNVDRMFLIR